MEPILLWCLWITTNRGVAAEQYFATKEECVRIQQEVRALVPELGSKCIQGWYVVPGITKAPVPVPIPTPVAK